MLSRYVAGNLHTVLTVAEHATACDELVLNQRPARILSARSREGHPMKTRTKAERPKKVKDLPPKKPQAIKGGVDRMGQYSWAYLVKRPH